MKSIDEEWSRLTGLYTAMSEGELEKLANEAYELTDIARHVLGGEISRRGLQIRLRNEPAPLETAPAEEPVQGFDPEQWDLVGIDRAYDMQDARRIRGILDQARIPSYFGPDNIENVEKLKPSFAAAEAEAQNRGFETGIKVRVPSQYIELASQALAQAPPQEQSDAQNEPDYMAVCPRCHSPEIVFQGLDENSSGASEDSKFAWNCDACGHQWKDDGVEQQSRAAS